MNQRKSAIFLLCALALVLVLQVVVVQARTLHVEWSYSGSAVSYKLYENGAFICISNDPSNLHMDCDVVLEDSPMVFTLSAVDASGVESPQSSPYILVPPPKAATGYIPQADIITSSSSGYAPLAVHFDASASNDIDGTIASYHWDFGDGEVGGGGLDRLYIYGSGCLYNDAKCY